MSLTITDPLADVSAVQLASELLDRLEAEEMIHELELSLDGPILPRPQAVLFGVDGTLVSASDGHLRCLAEVAAPLLGRPIPVESWTCTPVVDGQIVSGKVDAEIFRSLLDHNPMLEDILAGLVDEYAERYACELADGLQSCTAVAGVSEMLDMLAASGVKAGLATGNAHRVAEAKLEAVGISRHFAFDRLGGFGDWRAGRPEVVRAAVRTVGQRPGKQVWLVGDSTAEMRIARLLNLTGIGVATGAASIDSLRDAGARTVLRSAADLGGLLGDEGLLRNAG